MPRAAWAAGGTRSSRVNANSRARKLSALRKKQPALPVYFNVKPAIIGPTMRDKLNCVEFIAIALVKSDGGHQFRHDRLISRRVHGIGHTGQERDEQNLPDRDDL